ncbi:MAG TPA: hypothetical protein VHV26_00205, partial [Rhizomicrobium sp.]|jgi:hypothetical protein|nr:hypothetical protein [Rhizomicrobium sp.]
MQVIEAFDTPLPDPLGWNVAKGGAAASAVGFLKSSGARPQRDRKKFLHQGVVVRDFLCRFLFAGGIEVTPAAFKNRLRKIVWPILRPSPA